ncbi:MAG: GNAT family N-acetyltransferase [Acetobacteraceae bacterium]
MSRRKLLIDTNVFIGLEDEREVAPEFATLQQLCAQHNVRIFIHERAAEDIARDRDAKRRAISLSKIRKFGKLARVSEPPKADLVTRFGPMPKPNDDVDVALLYALEINAVDFLVTQDQGIHTRARRASPGLGNRVLTVPDAVIWLRAAFEPKQVRLPLVEEVPAYAVPLDDEIFDSLREGYPGFDQWWQTKCVPAHRECWVVSIAGEIAGLVVRKEETHAEAGTRHVGPKILKVCTFKVKPKFRGEKLGELLLKQILWFAQVNAYDLVYLTTFENQAVLIEVLTYYGFAMTGTNALGEHIYEKPLLRDLLVPGPGDGLFDLARMNYPRFAARPPATTFCIPIKSAYHDILFPELAVKVPKPQGDLFELPSLSDAGQEVRRPGNTIRKVYLCRASSQQLQPGSVVLFYRGQSPGYLVSQSITSVGIVEAIHQAVSLNDLVRLTAKRSVYSESQLAAFRATAKKPVKVIDFLLVGHIEPAIKLAELLKLGVFNSTPPQSISQLPPPRFELVRNRMSFGFAV